MTVTSHPHTLQAVPDLTDSEVFHKSLRTLVTRTDHTLTRLHAVPD